MKFVNLYPWQKISTVCGKDMHEIKTENYNFKFAALADNVRILPTYLSIASK